jgi:hypothetical protein
VSETHLILPVPAAEPVVAAHRASWDPSARAGVPAHITVLGPFIERGDLTSDDLRTLGELFAATSPIEFELARVARFDHALYLEPEPWGPFVELTQAVWRLWPDQPPYGGAHREIVPHLTVALGGEDFYDVEAALERHLPLRATAREVWLIALRSDERWVVHRRFALAAG